MSIFANVKMAPPDPILNLATRFKSDTFPKKVNLGIGAYRTEEGKPWILDSVREAEKLVISDMAGDKEYQPIDGKPEYKRPVQDLIFPPEVIESGRVATLQALSGTGSLQMISQFMKEMGLTKIHGPVPTWGNHPKIFNRAGLEYAGYPYWHQETRSLDFEGMKAAMQKMGEGEAILLHAVAHNPTGVDPTPAQWTEIVDICKKRKLVPLIDNAYQGYASGDLAKDGMAQQMFIESGMEFFIAQSFAKNFGLYGERIGYIHVLCATKEAADCVLSQLKICVRQAYSSPPKHGAAIVYTVLSNPALKAQWLGELKLMSDRIVAMRSALRSAVEAKSTPGTWNHITDQIGMFTFTGLEKDETARMVEEFHIYMTGDGRISMAGLNPNNVEYVAECINEVVKGNTRKRKEGSIFASVKMAPPDPILNLATRFKSDTFAKKVNLGIGAYRTEEGKPWILDSVREAEKLVISDMAGDKEYQPIDGKPEYKRPVQDLIFPPEVIVSGRVATLQALSGTGSLQMISQFMKEMGLTKIHGPVPTWGNHPKIFNRAGLEYAGYPYWHQETRSLDFEGMKAAMQKMGEGEAILLHAVAHNPTGVDPTPAQWTEIVDICKKRKLVPLIDNAYQGYASGDLAKDGMAQQMFIESGMEFFIAQSFAKNFGLYGERIGYIHVLCATKEAADCVLSQLKICVRQAYSSPPKHGAAIVYTVLSNPALKTQWLGELKLMSDRIVAMRSALRSAVEAKSTPGTWNHITDQIGMFTFTGLVKEQTARMVEEFHIYMTGDGRISMAGLNPNNVDYVAECINAVVKGA